ncbi:MAG: N-acyl homoserine lactonase family protein, partial [Rhodobacteraceae bacterium]
MQAAGFVKGKPVALHVLDYGLFRVNQNGRVIGICGFVIRTDAGETILVDTGFPPKYAADKEAATAEDDLGSFGEVLVCGPGNLPGAQLAKLGLTAADVTL